MVKDQQCDWHPLRLFPLVAVVGRKTLLTSMPSKRGMDMVSMEIVLPLQSARPSSGSVFSSTSTNTVEQANLGIYLCSYSVKVEHKK
jgi:hypothetical protein